MTVIAILGAILLGVFIVSYLLLAFNNTDDLDDSINNINKEIENEKNKDLLNKFKRNEDE